MFILKLEFSLLENKQGYTKSTAYRSIATLKHTIIKQNRKQIQIAKQKSRRVSKFINTRVLTHKWWDLEEYSWAKNQRSFIESFWYSKSCKNFSDKIVNLMDIDGHFNWTKQSLDKGPHKINK